MWYLRTRCHVPEEPEILNMDWLRPPHHKDAPNEDYDNANRAHHKDAPEEDCDDANNHKGVHSEDCDDANGAIDVPNEDNDDAKCLSQCVSRTAWAATQAGLQAGGSCHEAGCNVFCHNPTAASFSLQAVPTRG